MIVKPRCQDTTSDTQFSHHEAGQSSTFANPSRPLETCFLTARVGQSYTEAMSGGENRAGSPPPQDATGGSHPVDLRPTCESPKSLEAAKGMEFFQLEWRGAERAHTPESGEPGSRCGSETTPLTEPWGRRLPSLSRQFLMCKIGKIANTSVSQRFK